MSDAVSALAGASSEGLVRVAEAGLCGMVTLKGDLAAMSEAIRAASGHGTPDARGMSGGLGGGVAWMAPDEVLILCDHAKADRVVADLSEALKGSHHLAVNVSDARAIFTLSGDAVRDVLGKLTPADLSALAPGEMRRSRLAQVPAAFWLDGADTAHVICFRSVAQYVFDLLRTAARDGGPVGFHKTGPSAP